MADDLRKAFGRRVRALREEQGLSQETLAERGGFHWTYVSDIERGQRGPSLDVLGRIAGALNITIGELFSPLRGHYPPKFRSTHRLVRKERKPKAAR